MDKHPHAIIFLTAILWVAVLAGPAMASWPAAGALVCTQPNTQFYPCIVSDGAGGIIVAWSDNRNHPDERIYAQRYDGSGTPAWLRDGLLVSPSSNNTDTHGIVTDGAFGAIVVWTEGGEELRAQRIDADGVHQWPSATIVDCLYPEFVTVIPDGFGGVIIVWQDDPLDGRTRAQRIDANGNQTWGAGGMLVFDTPHIEKEPCAIADGNGGVFVATVYRKNVGYYEIIAQRVRQSGGRWPNSIYLSPLSTELKQDLAITSNDAGGAFVTWMAENDTTSGDIRLNRIGVDGALPWPSPVVVCDELGYQLNPDIIGDGFGNAVVAWEDYRNSNDEIYAQKVDAYGTAVWATNGIQICQGCDEIRGPRLIPGVSSNVIVTFSTWTTIYAEAIDANGSEVWGGPGYVSVIDCNTGGGEEAYHLTTDEAGGILAAVGDDRGIAGYDIFALPVNSFGQLYRAEPTITAVTDVPDDQGGWVRLSINASDRDVAAVIIDPVTNYDVWRRVQSTIVLNQVPATGPSTTAPVGIRIVELDGRRFVEAAAGGVIPPGTWEQIGGFSAAQKISYTYLAPTMSDSSSSGAADESYFITAHTTNPAVWFPSLSASGHSVDNIPPHVPGGFSIAYNVPPTGENRLQWDPSPDADFKYFRIYRSEDPGFVPSPANYIHGTIDWSWADLVPEGWRYHYKVTAVDMADNESDPANGSATGVGDRGVPLSMILGQNVPNPFNPATAISFGLPAEGHVILSIYDIRGARVRTLVDGPLPAGYNAVAWNGADDAGNRVSSGVYFYRLNAGGETITRKMLLLK